MSLFLGYSSGFLQVYHLPTSTSRYFKLFLRLPGRVRVTAAQAVFIYLPGPTKSKR